MRTEITRRFRFEAAHRLPHVPEGHKCARLHGHSFRVAVVVAGEVDAALGWIVDYADLDRAWEPLHALLDHRYLNEVPGLDNPTSERIAALILERFSVRGARVVRVHLDETCNAGVTVYAD
ncbi:MAG: 6-carboxytetrahydropterin synthase QueD [Myxococcales bacterium]|nr:6-carboxytetrahydropterin synthase QueD [Myxococcales bacterium]